MKIRIHQIKISLDDPRTKISRILAKKLRSPMSAVENFKIIRRSVDARSQHNPPQFVLSVELDFPTQLLTAKLKKQVEAAPDKTALDFSKFSTETNESRRLRPVVVGAGPAGLMAALSLAEAGLKPLLIERGASVEERREQVDRFWKEGELNDESNALFGEGGAGLFSDGKLTSRSKDRPRLQLFLQNLVRCGAPDSILIDAEPHLGSDQLTEIIPNLRNLIIEKGGEIRFNQRLENVNIESGVLTGVQISGESFKTDACILATGHSARDVYKMLALSDVPLVQKPFAVGVRLELPQHVINQAQWKKWASHPRLGAASFRLTRKAEADFRSCYTFCMCPGGVVISCASSAGMLTTNGMSDSARELEFGNAAFLAPVHPEDIPKSADDEPAVLDGYKFQESIEKLAFEHGGSDYGLPACRLNDFLAGRVSTDLPGGRSVQRAIPADFNKILPPFIYDTLRHTIPKMLKQLPGCSFDDVLVYAAETRSSSPIRMEREKAGNSTGITGLYPAGEGAGYAGGIVSAGIDGIKSAESVIQGYAIEAVNR